MTVSVRNVSGQNLVVPQPTALGGDGSTVLVVAGNTYGFPDAIGNSLLLQTSNWQPGGSATPVSLVVQPNGNTSITARVSGQVGLFTDPGLTTPATFPTSITTNTTYYASVYGLQTLTVSLKDSLGYEHYLSGTAVLDPANPTTTISATAPLGSGTYLSLAPTQRGAWQATTAYALADLVVAPSGDLVTPKVAFTSGGSYSSANWNTVVPAATAAGLGVANTWTGAQTFAKFLTISDPTTPELHYGSESLLAQYRGWWIHGIDQAASVPLRDFALISKGYGFSVTDASTTSGSPTLTSSQAGFTAAAVGFSVSGAGVPGGATITAVSAGGTTATMSANATATASGVTVTFTKAGSSVNDIVYVNHNGFEPPTIGVGVLQAAAAQHGGGYRFEISGENSNAEGMGGLRIRQPSGSTPGNWLSLANVGAANDIFWWDAVLGRSFSRGDGTTTNPIFQHQQGPNATTIVTGAAVTAASTTQVTASGTTFAFNLPTRCSITFTSGTLNGQTFQITAVDSTQHILTVATMGSTPSNGDTFNVVMPADTPLLGLLQDGSIRLHNDTNARLFRPGAGIIAAANNFQIGGSLVLGDGITSGQGATANVQVTRSGTSNATLRLQTASNGHFLVSALGASAEVQMVTQNASKLSLGTNGSVRAFVPAAGGMVVGTVTLATSATDGFLYVPSAPGGFTGTPTTQTGTIAMAVDSSGLRVGFYVGGAWKYAALS